MRHSFIPQSEQRLLKKEYRAHVYIVALFMLSFVVLVGVATLFPTYVAVYMEERDQANKLALLKQDKDNEGVSTIERELAHAAREVGLLSVSPSSTALSPVVQSVVSARGSVRLVALSVDLVSTTTMSVIVQGTAPTRESLVAFKARLETLSPGAKVELPISELAKSKDIDFSMRITLSVQ